MDCPQLLEAILRSLPRGPPLPQSQEEPSPVESLSCLESLRLLCYEPKKTEFLKDLWLGCTAQIISLSWSHWLDLPLRHILTAVTLRGKGYGAENLVNSCPGCGSVWPWNDSWRSRAHAQKTVTKGGTGGVGWRLVLRKGKFSRSQRTSGGRVWWLSWEIRLFSSISISLRSFLLGPIRNNEGEHGVWPSGSSPSSKIIRRFLDWWCHPYQISTLRNLHIFRKIIFMSHRLCWKPIPIAATSQLSAKEDNSGPRNKDFRAKVMVPKGPLKALGGLQQKWPQRQAHGALHGRKCAFMEKEGPQEASLLRSTINHQTRILPHSISKPLQRWDFLSLP